MTEQQLCTLLSCLKSASRAQRDARVRLTLIEENFGEDSDEYYEALLASNKAFEVAADYEQQIKDLFKGATA